MKGQQEPWLLPERLLKLKETEGHSPTLIYSCAPTAKLQESLPSGEGGGLLAAGTQLPHLVAA